MATKAKKNITTGETVIRIEGMHKWFGNFHALKDIDLEVFQGEKIAVSYTHLTLPTICSV